MEMTRWLAHRRHVLCQLIIQLPTKNARITNGGRYSHKFGVDSTGKLLKTFTGQSSGYRLWLMLSLKCLPRDGDSFER